ncbi:sugar kinase [Caproiciproducens sp. CPB-2]|uniref:sugar kinase n=1 Tax=Caproiciproducens sp. CPB-2 TaxID=3030017 RepID=UPI0023DC0D4E|nr:sugar kinase [Caproiciproducens sp. CPB-2]MDF1496356.1 sugar kinase [Caproiciproducens sp. CPB-2]
MSKGMMLIGEPMGLFIAQSEGRLEDIPGFSCAVAGAEFNVAVGMTRLELSASYLTKLGRDPFGKQIVKAMERNGIDTNLVSWSEDHSTGFMMKSMVSSGDPDIFYFRKNSAASTLSAEDIARVDFSAYQWVHVTGILPALSQSTREATMFLLEKARENGLTVSFDPNLRPQLWASQQEMVRVLNEIAAKSDIVLPGDSEGLILTGSREPEAIAEFYLKRGAKTVVVKQGPKGAYAARAEERFFVPGFPVEKVVDTVGAGDGFAVGIISALMENLPLREAVRRGNAIGAIQVMSRGDNEGLPTREQLQHFMQAK